MADIEWWQTLVSGAAGGVLTLAGQQLLALQQRHEDRRRDALKAQQVQRERVDGFEESSLKDLHDAMLALLIEAGRIYRAKLAHATTSGMQFGEGDAPGVGPYDDALGSAVARVTGLTGLVLDDDLRERAVLVHHDLLRALTTVQPVDEARATSDRVIEDFGTTLEGISEELRRIYVRDRSINGVSVHRKGEVT